MHTSFSRIKRPIYFKKPPFAFFPLHSLASTEPTPTPLPSFNSFICCWNFERVCGTQSSAVWSLIFCRVHKTRSSTINFEAWSLSIIANYCRIYNTANLRSSGFWFRLHSENFCHIEISVCLLFFSGFSRCWTRFKGYVVFTIAENIQLCIANALV